MKKLIEGEELLVPTFEMVSCPSISLSELKENMQKGELGKTEIIDLVSGKKQTVKEMYDSFLKTLAHIGERDLQ